MPILESLGSNHVHRALVECWRVVRDDTPFFEEAERLSNEDPEGHARERERLLEAIVTAEKLRLLNLEVGRPLALLQAIDHFLHQRFGAQDGPPPIVALAQGRYFIHHRPTVRHRQARHAGQMNHPHSWLRHHWVVPERIEGIWISIKAASAASLPARLFSGRRHLKVFVCNFADAVKPDWYRSTPGGWTADRLTDLEKRWESIRSRLGQARAAEADIVVFPELAVCPELRRRISDWMDDNPDHGFLMLVPGSFHEERDGGRFNYTELLGRTAKPMIAHRKLTAMGEKGEHEGIRTGDAIELLLTPVGLVAVPICLDFCLDDARFAGLWESIGCEFHLVPAFGPDAGVRAHLRRAEFLLRTHGAVCALANQDREGLDQAHGFVCHDLVPGRAPEIAEETACVEVAIGDNEV